MTTINRSEPLEATRELLHRRFPEARVIFLAGSVVRGEATPHSDLDLVVIFDRVEHAWRESFTSNGWPVEVFAHDPETLHYFFTEVDRPTGIASLANMVLDGVEVPSVSELSISLKSLARDIIVHGPPRLSEQDLAKLRYMITDLIDDVRSPRSVTELVAVGAKLYETLADGFLRTRDRWSARGKGIPRQLGKVDATFADRHRLAFETLFSHHDARQVIALAEEVLEPIGGWLFDGHRLDSQAQWRKAVPEPRGAAAF